MRVAAWAFVVCTVLSAVGVFVPSLEVRIAGVSLSHRATLSLYQINTSRALVRRLIATYHRSPGTQLGAKLGGVVMKHVGGAAHEALDDALSAMETLDTISDDDARTGGQVFVVVIWTFLGLSSLMAAIMFGELMRGGPFRGARVAIAVALSVLVTPVAIGTCVMTRALVFEANDELGVDFLASMFGAYVVPIAACIALVAGIVVAIKRPRAARAAS